MYIVDDYNNVKHFCHIYINYHLVVFALIKQLNGMSSLVDKMNAEGVCNSACQKRKKLERLRNDYMRAKNKLRPKISKGFSIIN